MTESIWGGDGFPDRQQDGTYRYIPFKELPLKAARFTLHLVRAIGGIVPVWCLYSEACSRWEVRVFRHVPGEGERGVSTYIDAANLEVMELEKIERIGFFRGLVLNGIFVAAGAP